VWRRFQRSERPFRAGAAAPQVPAASTCGLLVALRGNMERIAVGIDLGGTKIRAGVVSEGGKLLGESLVATQADRDAETVFANIVRAARDACGRSAVDEGSIAGVGIGSPAPIDIGRGLIVSPRNLPSLHGFPIVARLRESLGKPVVLNNDGNCFGLAEARFGAGKGSRACCGLTLGTGLGCAVVLAGRLWNGPGGAAAEIWCSPYRGRMIEDSVSGRGLSEAYALRSGRQESPARIAELARAGEEDALEAWHAFGRDLAVPVAYLCNIIDPDVVVLGGSLSKAFDLFQRSMLMAAMPYVNRVNRERVKIVPAALGDAAGVLGAAALVFTEIPAGT